MLLLLCHHPPPQVPRQVRMFLPMPNKAAQSPETWSHPAARAPGAPQPLASACLPTAAIILGLGPWGTVFLGLTLMSGMGAARAGMVRSSHCGSEVCELD